MQKIIYFLAGATATGPELAEIAAFNEAVAQGYQIQVSNGSIPPGLGNMPNPDPDPEPEDPTDVVRPEVCDFVAGTVPDLYAGKPEITPAEITGALTDTQIVVTDGDEIVIGEDTYTFTVVEGEITAIVVT